MGGDTERCGRCGMTTAVDVAETDAPEFEDERIEVEETKVRAVARPAVWIGRVRRWLDDVATRLTYGRYE